LVADHVLANRCERADLLELNVEGFDLFGDASSFPRYGGAVRSPVCGGEGWHRAECTTRRNPQTCAGELLQKSAGRPRWNGKRLK